MTDTQRLREIQERHGSSIFGCVPEFCTICFLLKQIAALRAMPTPAGEDAELAHRLRECESTLRGAQMVYTADCVSKAADHIEALSAKPGPASQQEPTQAEIEAFFAIYSADVRYEAADHPRMLWLIGRALKSFVANRNLREPASREETK